MASWVTLQDTVFLFWLNFKFLQILTFIDRMVCSSKFILFIHMHIKCDICRSYTFLTKRKACQYRWCMCSQWQNTFIIVVSSNETTLRNRGYCICKKAQYIWHISPLIPQVAPTHLTMCGQCCICYKNVFTSCVSDHKTFQGHHTP
jgi:hypothetical protein